MFSVIQAGGEGLLARLLLPPDRFLLGLLQDDLLRDLRRADRVPGLQEVFKGVREQKLLLARLRERHAEHGPVAPQHPAGPEPAVPDFRSFQFHCARHLFFKIILILSQIW